MPALSRIILRDQAVTKTDFTAADLDKYIGKGYFRFQCLDWEVRDYSCGMMYADAEEAIEDGSTVLNGKSCVRNWRQLDAFSDSFGDGTDFVVMVFSGYRVGEGHDGEDVVTPERFLAAFDATRFLDILEEEKDLYRREGWSLLDFTV
ncbi:MAG: hypothetical protein M0P69_20340 [Bacteroidales bacterium]|nr:hypothetical protein [Bacteroidales bacterium]